MESSRRPTPLLRTSSSGSVSLNELDLSKDDQESEAIYLLRQIFPGSSASELRNLHRNRLHEPRVGDAAASGTESASGKRAQVHLKSKLGQRVLRKLTSSGHGDSCSWRNHVVLPHDFLRLSPDVAVRRLDTETGQWHYQIISELASRVIGQHMMCRPSSESLLDGDCFYTKALFRDPSIGLGLTLSEQTGYVFVYSLTSRDGRIWSSLPENIREASGPAIRASVRVGDALIGVNGMALLHGAFPSETLLQYAVRSIRDSDDPVVLHFMKKPPARISSPAATVEHFLCMTDGYSRDEPESVGLQPREETVFHSTPTTQSSGQSLVHPFVAVLRRRGLLDSFEAERANTMQFHQFTGRTRDWEATSFLNAYSQQTKSHFPVPVEGVRKALCVRILNAFMDGEDVAYTIWVYDVATGLEWYAPVRYLRDFSDLRSALSELYDVVSDYPFPKQSYSLFGSPSRREKAATSEATCRQLEDFLRCLCSITYREKIHPKIGEVAVYVQSFLGCEVLATGSSTADNRAVRHSLKRSIQQYTFRLFLLEGIQKIVKAFIDMMRGRGPGLEDLEYLESQERSLLKTRAMQCLEETRAFLDQLQNIILEGCTDDFRSISAREEYRLLQELNENGGEIWEALVREAVREQIEIEVYVPLRGVVSRWLVHGWRYEDMEVQFKVNELRRRPQDSFRIPPALMSSSWSTACNILKGGVGQSTLPCVKLRAIVDAARELSLLVASAQEVDPGDRSDSASTMMLGADDFLPIFIYCVVKAEMERPCALSVLLRTLCDPINRIGEIGYYLACFESAIRHIQELDLSVNDLEAFSLLSVPLNDSY